MWTIAPNINVRMVNSTIMLWINALLLVLKGNMVIPPQGYAQTVLQGAVLATPMLLVINVRKTIHLLIHNVFLVAMEF